MLCAVSVDHRHGFNFCFGYVISVIRNLGDLLLLCVLIMEGCVCVFTCVHTSITSKSASPVLMTFDIVGLLLNLLDKFNFFVCIRAI
jgi:hypothetical protein